MWPRPTRRILLSFLTPKLPSSKAFSRIPSVSAIPVRPPLIMPSAHKFTNDRIFIESFQLKCTCGRDAFGRQKTQPVRVSVDIRTSIARAAASDDVGMSVDYSRLNKKLIGLDGATFEDVPEMMGHIGKIALGMEQVGKRGDVFVTVELEKGALCAEKVVWSAAISGEDEGLKDLRLAVYAVEVPVIIGIRENLHERETCQPVVFDLEWELGDHSIFNPRELDVQAIASSIIRVTSLLTLPLTSQEVKTTNYESIESLSTLIATLAQKTIHSKVQVTLRKPYAIPFANAAGVSITRPYQHPAPENKHVVFIAMGSNLGNRVGTIEKSLEALRDSGIRVHDVSGLYESDPMYVEEQPRFLNAVCKVPCSHLMFSADAKASTALPPLELLKVLKNIEDKLGRIPSIPNGPRALDLDVLLYDQEILNLPDLIIPHTLMLERSFVLQPLADIAPDLLHPVSFATIQSHLQVLPPPPQHNFLPLRSTNLKFDITHNRKPTLIMAILNLTPDSFSDGGKHSLDPTQIVQTVREMVKHGADIIDIGGQSTRPDAEEVSAQEEMERVIPAIEAIRKAGLTIPISVDTYRAGIAKAAIEAGADIINDVSAGTLDADMFSVAAMLNVPVILVHMRGTPKTMNSLSEYKGDLIALIAQELSARVTAAVTSGIRRWNILLDPGLGFAKMGAQNLEIIRRLDALRREPGLGGCPWVVGPSRKRFVGAVTGESVAKERVWGTAGAVAASVQGGADIVRVHDVLEIGKVVKMCDAIWRGVH